MGKSKCGAFIESLDFYSVTVGWSLTYRGSSRFSTVCGGVVSVLTLATFITLIALKLAFELEKTDQGTNYPF